MNNFFLPYLTALPRDKIDTLQLIFTCTFVLLPFTVHAPLWVNVSAGLLITWRVWIVWRGLTMPPKWLLTLLTAALLANAWIYFRTWVVKDVGITFLIGLASLKMLEMHARRDAVAVLFVCYFLLVGQLLYSQSLLAALYLMLCIGLLISTQITFQYHQLTPSFKKRFFSGFYILGLAIPLALILFLLFPRLPGPLWGKQQNNLSGVTGLSETMELGNVADLALSEQIAFRVKFAGGNIPTPSQRYWRAIVLDTFNGQRWSASQPHFSHELLETTSGLIQEIILEPHNQRWLFGLDRPINADISSSLTRYGELRSHDRIQDRIRYTVISHLPQTRVIWEPIETRHKALQLPVGYNPLTLQWAKQLQAKSSSPIQFVNTVLSYFHEQPFRYTMSPPPLGTDQIDDFLFGTQAGFCEHYASAFVVIMRAAGIPARVVTGYQGGELNPIDNLMTIRQADAHAWAEVWIEPRGWQRVDPTAAVSPLSIERGLNGSFPNRQFVGLIDFSTQTWLSNLAKAARLRWDAINSAWNLWVLNYNLNKQKDLLSSLTGIKQPQAVQIGMVMMLMASLLVAVFSFLLLRKNAKRNPLDKLYDDFCRQMSNQGFPRLSYEGPRAYGQRLQSAFDQSEELIYFLSLYSDYKYGKEGDTQLPESPLATLRALLKVCRHKKPFNVSRKN